MTDRILPPGPVAFDDDGDPIPQPAAQSDLADLIQMLEYGRKKGFRFGPVVHVGKIITQVQDLRQTEGRGIAQEPDEGAWAAAGYKPDAE